MKKFIGAMIFGVIVVILMVTQWTGEQQAEQTPAEPFNAPLEAQMHAEERQASPSDAEDVARSMEAYEVSEAESSSVEVAAGQADEDDSYVAPQPSSLAQVEAERDRSITGRNTVNIDLVPYQLQYEAVDYQWFREMEQALYSLSYDFLEPIGARMVNLECATSVCVAEFDIPPYTDFEAAAFYRAAEEMDIFDREKLSMVYLSSEGVLERIIFQRKE